MPGAEFAALIVGWLSSTLAACGGQVGGGESHGQPGASTGQVGIIDGGQVVTLASGYVNAIAVDATGVYLATGVGGWAEGTPYPMDGTIIRAALDGSSATTLAAGQRFPIAIALGAGNVYWANGQVGTSQGWIMRAPLAGGTAATFAAQQSVVDIAVDQANAYWTASGALWRQPIAGGPPTTLASSGASGGHLALDAANVYWGNPNEVLQLPLDGGAPVTLAQGLGVGAMAAAGGNLYWTGYSTGSNVGTVMKTPVGGGATTSLASVASLIVSIATDASSVYFTNLSGGAVAKVSVGGGAVTTLASGQNTPDKVTIDSTSVYWVNDPGGNAVVLKLTPR